MHNWLVYMQKLIMAQNELYKEIVYQTINFVARELMSQEGGFYSALDADSEGEEGKFYVWTYSQWQEALDQIELNGIDKSLFAAYYHVERNGNWEHGNNILYRTDDEEFAKVNKIAIHPFKTTLEKVKSHLLAIREKRIRPGLDDKILCSWNGLMLRGLVDAYRVFGEQRFLELALQNARFIREKMRKDKQLFHSYKNGRVTITGYLEDYAFVIDAYIGLYQATFEEEWLMEAKTLTKYVIDSFYDSSEELFYFTDIQAEKLIARKKELFDNVIPASNSAMAKNLYFLGLLVDKPDYIELSDKMLARVKKLVITQPQYLSNWASIFSYRVKPTAEIAIVGPQAEAFRRTIEQYSYPNKVLTGTTTESELPLLENREAINGETTIYVCYDKACHLPVYSPDEAMQQVAQGQK